MERIDIPKIQLRQTVWLSLDTLRANKFRSFLTILGVVIGVTSVIAVASIIQGLNNVVQDRIAALGTKVFFVSRIPPFIFSRLPERIRKRKFLYLEDAIAVREQCPSVEYATPFQQRAVFTGQPNLVRYGNERVESAVLRSAEPQYISVLPIFSMRDGRFISDFDNEHSAMVCAIGSGIADTLFPSVDPVGKEINLNGQMFLVIGVFERDPGLFGGPGIDQFVMIPYNTFHKFYPEIEDNILLVSAYDPALLSKAQDEVVDVLRRRRRVPTREENDFEMQSPDILSQVWEQLTGAVVILTMVISSIGLLVGGIGVMNIMLVAVTERTHEIGIRKAVGARRRDILAQFLIEAMTLTGTGGVIGILAGSLISLAVRTFLPALPSEVSLLWIATAFSVSVGVGLFFGIFPARRAAELDPIVSLRYE
ncbi:MAG: FtsX-like permease family protein [Acidimicrobiia bacterium]|nr:FtsX-like permease family protein [Acidimicrobiia bacterium]